MTRRSFPLPASRSAVPGLILAASMLLAMVAAWFAATAAPAVRAQENPRLASLEISVWPEFDRPAMALVILRGKLAEEVSLPATVALHIPTASGGPFAVASASSETDPLLSLSYGLAAAEDSLLVTINTPDPYFQIEFYEPLSVDTSDRSFTYVWPGDLPVDELTLEVQEPVGATDISTEPNLGEGAPGPDRLIYRSAEMGALELGETLTLSVSYVKTDLSTSLEVSSPGQTGTVAPAGEGSDDGFPLWAILLIAVVAVVVIAAALGYWRWQSRLAAVPAGAGRRPGRRAEGAASATFCPQCGEQLEPGHRFCPRCGTAARGK